MVQILDGKKLAAEITVQLKKKVVKFKKKGITPKLKIILVGDNPTSAVYIRMKQKKAEEIGAICEVEKFDKTASEFEILKKINDFNHDETVHGIIIQLPLPKNLNANTLLNKIVPTKDVDGLSDTNQIKILNNSADGLVPATPRGVMMLLDEYKIPVEGKKAVVIGRSRLVGRTCALLLLNRNATVTICHSKTLDIKSESNQADILIVAAGAPRLVKADYIKPGACVIDVGITQTANGLMSDVDFAQVKDAAGFISPVPGGVGPMTVVCLFTNLLEAAGKQT